MPGRRVTCSWARRTCVTEPEFSLHFAASLASASFSGPLWLGGASRTFHSSDLLYAENLGVSSSWFLSGIPATPPSSQEPHFLGLCSERKGSRGFSRVSHHCHGTGLGPGKGDTRSQTGRLPRLPLLCPSTRSRSLFVASVAEGGCGGLTPPRPRPDVLSHRSY